MQHSATDNDSRLTAELLEFIKSNQPLVVLTGAGCSTDSGIPDYRDENGNWKYRQPVQYLDFLRSPETRKHYWSRSMLGWPRIADARPNAAHMALAELEDKGYIRFLVTQNVDGLHQKAGSSSMMELHGGLDWVVCMECDCKLPRAQLQETLRENNPDYDCRVAVYKPDGEASMTGLDPAAFLVPDCPRCHGILKPDVVFFGEQVPKYRIESVLRELDRARALLIIGSSLMVFSGYRFCKYIREQEKPVAILNRGRTRADGDITFKIDLACQAILPEIARKLLSPNRP